MRLVRLDIDPANELFLELFGAMIGDGCIVRFEKKPGYFAYRAFLTGNATSDKTYWTKHLHGLLSKLGVTAYLHFRKPTNPANKNAVDLVINLQEFSRILIKLGFPIGRKRDIKLPEWILTLPENKQHAVVRGLFDTDGCLSARKSEGYRRPIIIISSGSAPLRAQLRNLLRTMGFPAYDSSGDVGVNGIANARKWFKKIGSNNERNQSRYQAWLQTGALPPRSKQLK